MSAYLITRLCAERGLYNPRSLVVGMVEIRSPTSDADDETNALQHSLKEYKMEVDLELCPRMTTLVDATDHQAADRVAEIRFEQTLDLLSAQMPGISEYRLLDAGLSRALPAGEARVRVAQPRFVGPTTTYQVLDEPFPKLTPVEWFGHQAKTELILRYERAIHWQRRARWERDSQLATLYRWFAIEAACKVDKNTNIVPIISAALGFPRGQHAAALSQSFTRKLQQHPRYKAWSSEVLGRLQALSNWRNDSVHSGFRPWDVDEQTLRQFSQLSLLGAARVLGRVSEGIMAGLTTAKEFNQYLPVLLENTSLIPDIHRTVIYSLEHPGSF